MVKRKIFVELIEGVEAMKKHRDGKLTPRSYQVEAAPLPAVNSKKDRRTQVRTAAPGASQKGESEKEE